MKIIFFGNTEFSNPTLEKCNASFDIVSVVTNSSKKMGRGRHFSDTPVKILADKLKIQDYGGTKKQDLIKLILEAEAKKEEKLYATGCLEILSDRYGLLRSSECSYLPGPDDI